MSIRTITRQILTSLMRLRACPDPFRGQVGNDSPFHKSAMTVYFISYELRLTTGGCANFALFCICEIICGNLWKFVLAW